jgi:hypothetical protein
LAPQKNTSQLYYKNIARIYPYGGFLQMKILLGLKKRYIVKPGLYESENFHKTIGTSIYYPVNITALFVRYP